MSSVRKLLARARPVFDAAESVVFWSRGRTHAPPHVRDPLDHKRLMSMVIVALLPCVLAGVYFFGLRTLVVIAVSYAAGGAAEVLFACVRKHGINEGFLVTGLIFPLILPVTIPLWMVAVGIAFGVTVGKEIFGGTGRNLFNPALVGRCFLFLAYPRAMTARWVDPAVNTSTWGGLTQYLNLDAITTATPLARAGEGIFAPWGSLLWGNVPGVLGATSVAAVLLGGVLLLTTRVANCRPTVGMIVSFAVGGVILNASGIFGPPGDVGFVVFQMLSGGLLFGALFMATDPVSGPSTNPARWAYGLLIGAFTLLIRALTPLSDGVMFAILLGNVVAPILDELVVRLRMRKLAREA